MKSRGSLRWHFSASRKDTKRDTTPPVAGSTFACQGQPTPSHSRNRLTLPVSRYAAPMGRTYHNMRLRRNMFLGADPSRSAARSARILNAAGDPETAAANPESGTRERPPSRVDAADSETPVPCQPRCGNDGPAARTKTHRNRHGSTSATIPPRVVDLRAQGGAVKWGA